MTNTIKEMNILLNKIIGKPKREYKKVYWNNENLKRHLENCYLGVMCPLKR